MISDIASTGVSYGFTGVSNGFSGVIYYAGIYLRYDN